MRGGHAADAIAAGKGYRVLRKHHIVRFAFHGITQADLAQFIPANILDVLVFSPPAEFGATGQFTVGLESAMGGDLCGSFSASSGEVVAVLPCDKHAQPV